MTAQLILTGDVNLMRVTDPAAPFALVTPIFRQADVVFGNLECCLYQPPNGHIVEHEGFHADPVIGGDALVFAGFTAVGLANNVNYGEAAIMASINALDRLGIAHTGAGANRAAARVPAIVERGGLRFGFIQRSSVYWPTNHEAAADAPGIAVLRAHTAYQVPMHKTRPELPPMNRPGLPPIVVTWTDRAYLDMLRQDIGSARARCDVLVASFHWGLGHEVLAYMTEIAHAAIDAGADMVIGHGPHHFLPAEVYRGRPIFYGLGSFSFHTGHGGRKHGDWIGLMVTAEFEDACLTRSGCRFVRHNDRNETVPCLLAEEADATEEIIAASRAFGTQLTAGDDRLWLALQAGCLPND